MSFFSSPAFGQIAGSVLGGMFGNKAAKYQRNSDAAALAAQMAPFELLKPYLTELYGGASGALGDALGMGAYSGDTYAGMNPLADEGYGAMAGLGRNMLTGGQDVMNATGGFGANQADIYNRASQDTLSNAVDYATNSPQAGSMIDAIMRDDTRQLTEQTLPGIGLGASGTGNSNNSKRFMNEAIAQSRYDDRRADVSSDVRQGLADQYIRSNTQDLGNMMNANTGLMNMYGFGADLGNMGAGNMVTAGGAYQTDNQGRMDADRDAFERNRDFGLDMYGIFGDILGGMPSVGRTDASSANPYTAMLSGGSMGAGFGGKLFTDMFGGGGGGGGGYSGGFNPGFSGYYNNAGNGNGYYTMNKPTSGSWLY